jgi:hypothetical protein
MVGKVTQREQEAEEEHRSGAAFFFECVKVSKAIQRV